MKLSVAELLDLRLGRAAGEAEVELLERLDRRQRRQLQQRLSYLRSSRATISLASTLSRKSAKLASVARGVLRERRPLGAQAGELQLLAQRGDALVLQAHARHLEQRVVDRQRVLQALDRQRHALGAALGAAFSAGARQHDARALRPGARPARAWSCRARGALATSSSQRRTWALASVDARAAGRRRRSVAASGTRKLPFR